MQNFSRHKETQNLQPNTHMKKILGRSGIDFQVEMTDGTQRIMRPEEVTPNLKSEYYRQLGGNNQMNARPYLPRQSKQKIRERYDA